MIGWRTDHQVQREQLGLTCHQRGEKVSFLMPVSDWMIMCTMEQCTCKTQFACVGKYSICKCGCVDCGRERGDGGVGAAC